MKHFVQNSLLILMLALVNPAGVFLQGINKIESFTDCSTTTWNTIQANSNASDWNCTKEFEDFAIRLRGDRENFEIWLVSEMVQFDANSQPFIIFNYKNKKVNGKLELLYSTDFSGRYDYQEVVSASWETIPINLYPIGDDNEINTFIRHPAISLSELTEEDIYFSFRFTNESGDYDLLLDELWLHQDYYSRVESSIEFGYRCADIKSELSALIDDHQMIPYTASEFDTWDSHFTTDIRLNDRGDRYIIWDMYSDNPDGAEAYEYIPGRDQDFGADIAREGLYYNREHSFPKSWWGGDFENAQFSDIHFVIPVDKEVNSIRLNYPYGETANPVLETSNGSKLGNSTAPEYPNRVFEPIDEYKGDVARMHLYVATRYELLAANWKNEDSRGDAVLSGDRYTFFEDWYLNTLLKWHAQDPVSQKEIDRNNAVFSIQHNRNPFIDHPEYVGLIWGDEMGTACDEITSDEDVFTIEALSVYPNPVTDLLRIQTAFEFDRISVTSLIGRKRLIEGDSNFIHTSDFDAGVYMIQLHSNTGYSTIAVKFVKL